MVINTYWSNKKNIIYNLIILMVEKASKHREGYVFGEENLKKVPLFTLAKEFLTTICSFYDPDKFFHLRDCWYPDNNLYLEIRESHRMLRPSYCAKFVLQSSIDSGLFYDETLPYSYHGTKFKNIPSILEYGLMLPDIDDKTSCYSGLTRSSSKASQTHGNAVGDKDEAGIYTTKFPQYAEHYTDQEPIMYKGYYLSFLLLCRQEYLPGYAVEKWEQSDGSTRFCSCDKLYCLHVKDGEKQI